MNKSKKDKLKKRKGYKVRKKIKTKAVKENK